MKKVDRHRALLQRLSMQSQGNAPQAASAGGYSLGVEEDDLHALAPHILGEIYPINAFAGEQIASVECREIGDGQVRAYTSWSWPRRQQPLSLGTVMVPGTSWLILWATLAQHIAVGRINTWFLKPTLPSGLL